MAAAAPEQASDLVDSRKHRDEDGDENGVLNGEEPKGKSKEIDEDVLGNGDAKPVGKETKDAKEEEKSPKKPSKLKVLWGKVGLDVGTVMMMFKSVSFLHSPCDKLRICC